MKISCLEIKTKNLFKNFDMLLLFEGGFYGKFSVNLNLN